MAINKKLQILLDKKSKSHDVKFHLHLLNVNDSYDIFKNYNNIYYRYLIFKDNLNFLIYDDVFNFCDKKLLQSNKYNVDFYKLIINNTEGILKYTYTEKNLNIIKDRMIYFLEKMPNDIIEKEYFIDSEKQKKYLSIYKDLTFKKYKLINIKYDDLFNGGFSEEDVRYELERRFISGHWRDSKYIGSFKKQLFIRDLLVKYYLDVLMMDNECFEIINNGEYDDIILKFLKENIYKINDDWHYHMSNIKNTIKLFSKFDDLRLKPDTITDLLVNSDLKLNLVDITKSYNLNYNYIDWDKFISKYTLKQEHINSYNFSFLFNEHEEYFYSIIDLEKFIIDKIKIIVDSEKFMKMNKELIKKLFLNNKINLCGDDICWESAKLMEISVDEMTQMLKNGNSYVVINLLYDVINNDLYLKKVQLILEKQHYIKETTDGEGLRIYDDNIWDIIDKKMDKLIKDE